MPACFDADVKMMAAVDYFEFYLGLSGIQTCHENDTTTTTTPLRYHSTTTAIRPHHTLMHTYNDINARIQLTRRSSTHYCFLPCPACLPTVPVCLSVCLPSSSRLVSSRLVSFPSRPLTPTPIRDPPLTCPVRLAHPLPSTSSSSSPPGPQRLSPSSLSFPVACPAACQNEPLPLRLRINGPRKAGAAGLADGLARHLPQLR